MEKLVVVGNGMAGIGCVEQILKYSNKLAITIFGDETHLNYNRILLSSVLAGEKSADEIVLNSLEWYEKNAINLRLGVRIVDAKSGRETGRLSDAQVDEIVRFVKTLPGVDHRVQDAPWLRGEDRDAFGAVVAKRFGQRLEAVDAGHGAPLLATLACPRGAPRRPIPLI